MSEYVSFETCYQLAHALFAVPGVSTAADARAMIARFYGHPVDGDPVDRDLVPVRAVGPVATAADLALDTSTVTESVDGAVTLNRLTLNRMIESVAVARERAERPPGEPSPGSGTAVRDVEVAAGP